MSTWYDPDGNAVSGLEDVADTNRLSTLDKQGYLYKPNFRSFGRFIRSEQVREPVTRVAHQISVTAGVFSPRRKSGHGKGVPLADSFQVNAHAGEIRVDRALRVKVEVFNSNEAAAPMEFGNSRVGKPGHRMLGRAGAAYGDFKSGEGRP
jgi:hypothetical protein